MREISAKGELFLAYYNGLVADRGIPFKSQIEPADITTLLPDLVLYERRARDDFFIRLMGTRVVERIGLDATGDNALDLIDPSARAAVQAAFNRILDEPCGHYSVVVDRYASGREQSVEVLRLPLRDPDGNATFIISCTVALEVSRYVDPDDRPYLLAQPVEGAFFAIGGVQTGST